ncbi:hypothetical protein GDO78_015145, partial [Eleutherodactylus coqui]
MYPDAQAVSIEQDQPSLVKRLGEASTARIPCQINDRSSAYIHWYVQKPNQVIKRILYFQGENKPTYEAEFSNEKYQIRASNNKNTLTIHNLKGDDSGIYYCANWDRSAPHTDIKPQN